MTRIQFAGAATAMLLVATFAACHKPEPAKPAPDTTTIVEAIMADAEQRVAAVNTHDPDKYISHFAADAIAIRSGQANAVGPAAISASVKKVFKATPDVHVTLSDESVDVAASGDMAVFRSTSTATMTDPTTRKPVTLVRNSLAGYKLQPDGAWKIEWSLLSDIGTAPAAPPNS